MLGNYCSYLLYCQGRVAEHPKSKSTRGFTDELGHPVQLNSLQPKSSSRYHVEDIMYHENIRRAQLMTIVDKFRQVMRMSAFCLFTLSWLFTFCNNCRCSSSRRPRTPRSPPTSRSPSSARNDDHGAPELLLGLSRGSESRDKYAQITRAVKFSYV